MSDSKTRDAATGTDQPTSGAQVRIPVVRRQTYDTGKYIDHKSLGKDVSVEMVAAAGLSVSLVGGNVAHLEVIAGTTTLADIAAAVALDADLKAVYSATGIAGTIPLGFVSYSSDLWENVYAGASVMLVSDDAGNLTPFSGKSLIVDVKMDAFAAIPDSALSVGTDDGLVTGAKMVQKVTADGTVVQQTVVDKLLVTEKSGTAIAGSASSIASRVVETAAPNLTAADLLRKAVGTTGAEKSLADVVAQLTDSGAVSAAENLKKIVAEIVTGYGLKVGPYLPASSGATPTVQQGTLGRLPRDYAEDFGGGVTGTWHPLQYGVSTTRTIGAGPVTAAAVDKAVTVSGIIVGVTTLANIRAAIAADAPSAALVALAGDGVVDAGYAGGAAYDLWYSGTIPAAVFSALGPDGYFWPVAVDATGGIKVSQSSLMYGEGDSVPQLRVQRATFFGTTLAATGTGYATTCRLAALSVTSFTGAGTVTIRDGGAAGTVRYQNLAIAADGRIELDDVTFATDVHITFAGGLTASVTPIVAPNT